MGFIEKNKRLLSIIFPRWLKVSITLALCTIILKNADWENIISAVHNAKGWMVLIVFFILIINSFVSALKWQILLSIHHINYPLGKLTAYYLTAAFFNNFLPGTIGGDGYRIYKTLKNQPSKSGAVLSVLTERVFGLMILILLGTLGATGCLIVQYDEISLYVFIFGSLVVLLFTSMASLLSLKKVRSWALDGRKMAQNKIAFLIRHLNDYWSQPKMFLNFIVVTVIFYLLIFLSWMLIISALNETCSIFSLSMVIMVSSVLAMLPISLNGIGILDGSFIYLISHYGVSYEASIMIMVLVRMLTMALSLIGGFFYYLDKGHETFVLKQKKALQPPKESVY